MAVNQVTICNVALGHVGTRRQITAIDDQDDPDAKACNLQYELALKDALAEGDWAFARRRLDLDPYAGTPPAPWSHQYNYPASATCVRVLRIDDGLRQRYEEQELPYETETIDGVGRILYCNVADATVIYTYHEEDTAVYPSYFSTYLAWVLAARIAGPMTSDEGLVTKLEQKAAVELPKALTREYQTENEGPEPISKIIAARHGTTSDEPAIGTVD